MPDPVALSDRYKLVAEANRRVYDEATADEYLKDALVTPEEHALLEGDLRRALAHLGDRGRPIRALDCCGGAGNATLKLLEAGCQVTLVDISDAMVKRCRDECRRRGLPEPTTRVSEVATFLSQSTDQFDLAVFSSALHHLEDPVLVLTLARRILADNPPGVIVTIFDPVQLPRRAHILLTPLHLMDRAARHPHRIVTRAIPVFYRLFRGGGAYKHRDQNLALNTVNYGNIAEYHADTGFDDQQLARNLEAAGLRIIHHDRYTRPAGRFTTLGLRLLAIPTSFKFLLEKA